MLSVDESGGHRDVLEEDRQQQRYEVVDKEAGVDAAEAHEQDQEVDGGGGERWLAVVQGGPTELYSGN